MKQLIFIMAACLSLINMAYAKERTFNIVSNMFDNTKITNQSIMDFGTNSLTLGNIVWDTIEKRSGNRFLAGLGTYWIHWGWFWNEHEFGHGTRKRAMGMPTKFKSRYSYRLPYFFLQTLIMPVNPTQNNLWAATSGQTSELTYELGSDNPYVTYSGSGDNRIYERTDRGMALIAGGGFSNDSLWAETLGEKVYTEDNVHVSTTISYTLSKILPFFYVSSQGTGDVKEIAEATGISTGAVRTASLASLALSASTYSMWQSTINGEQYIKKQRTMGGFRLPDVSAYFTHGISYKINSGYTNNKTYIPLAFETVTNGSLQKQSEFTVGAVHKLNDKTIIDVRAIYNLKRKGLSSTSKVSYRVNDRITAYVSAQLYDLKTMYGERNTWDFRKNKLTSIYSGVNIRF